MFSSISLSADVSRINRRVKCALWYLESKYNTKINYKSAMAHFKCRFGEYENIESQEKILSSKPTQKTLNFPAHARVTQTGTSVREVTYKEDSVLACFLSRERVYCVSAERG